MGAGEGVHQLLDDMPQSMRIDAKEVNSWTPVRHEFPFIQVPLTLELVTPSCLHRRCLLTSIISFQFSRSSLCSSTFVIEPQRSRPAWDTFRSFTASVTTLHQSQDHRRCCTPCVEGREHRGAANYCQTVKQCFTTRATMVMWWQMCCGEMAWLVT